MRTPVVLLAAVAVLAGCGSSDKPAPTKPASSSGGGAAGAPAAARSYNPKIDPTRFSAHITNPYLPWKPGSKWVYTGLKDGAPERVDVTVTRERKTIMGVPCVVVRDVVTSNYTLVEKTVDWYSQDSKGNVWYFGEDTAEYKNGVVTSTQGTWEAGVDNAKPGIAMPSAPRVGRIYRQEFRPGLAEDKAKVLATDGVQTVPAGRFQRVVVTLDTDPLNPAKVEHKWYAPGIGMIHVKRIGSAHTEETKLVSRRG